ncbi:RHS repeat-associated protein [Pedobacter cryoconitis]|uniref:DUF6443 domain-containing protein n=1 Tax=Pedobacter cryoconitis TaxID=188932 RepID=UPI00160F2240|nr:DUF6443 domain-containing protein [Pedobacter cryoconitis]MBB6274369.1 RHS repeat-associated protein [Pedobacter cryoconitis]
MKLYLYYTALTLCAFFLSIDIVSAQQDTTLSVYTGQSEISARKRVILKSGFLIPVGKKVRIFTRSSFDNWENLLSKPTNFQNYILTRVFKKPNVMDDVTAGSNNFKTTEVNQTVQYLDGLGRPSQVVTIQGSPGFADVVQPVVYDTLGREAQRYLPYVSASTGGTFRNEALKAQGVFYNNPTAGIATNAYPYGVTVFESSPLSRVIEKGAPGAPWQPVANSASGHTEKLEYGTNGSDVKFWIAGLNSAEAKGNYPAGSLYKTTSKDENWKQQDFKAGTTDEYKDFEGHIVLKRIWESNTISLSTYYVYDDLGNLRYVLPPAVNENGQNAISSFLESDDVFKQFIYGYHYDGQNRLIKKQVPGKDWESMVYNNLDQVVLTQDANRKRNEEWIFTKYDAFGRLVMSGIYKDKREQSILQSTLDSIKTVLWEKRADTDIGYNNLSFPQNNITSYHIINYYDDYKFLKGSAFGPPSNSQAGEDRTKSLLTGTKINILGTDNMLLSVYYYDVEGRIVQSKSQNHLKGTDIIDNTYNFAGELTASVRNHTINGQTNETVIANSYFYDHMGRKIATKESINAQPEVVLSQIDYTETGQPLTKQLHSTNNGGSYLQKTDFDYNERGWLKHSISNQFSMRLNYNDGDIPQYNSNISNQLWAAGNIPNGNSFSYTYDKINRLVKGSSTGVTMSEILTYDVMGNIATLNRDGKVGKYNYNGNQIANISDGVRTLIYVHDANGNVISDGMNGMILSYNSLNLPILASKTGVSVSYQYDASGNKLSKTTVIDNKTSVRNYIQGIEYDGAIIDVIHTEEGLAQNNKGTYNYQYNLTDHLGNVRYSFQQHPESKLIDRLQSDDYYPFGLRKSSGSVVSLNNKYLYNGKELQDELGQYDYGARFYDPVIARWNVADPLAEKFQNLSPYNYADNNPVNNIDPNGMDVLYGQGIGGGDLYTGAEAQALFGQLIASQQGNQDGDKKKKKSETAEQKSQRLASEEAASFKSMNESMLKLNKFMLDFVEFKAISQIFTELFPSSDKAFSLPNVSTNKVNKPEGWITKSSKKGDGTVYQDPQNPHNSIREMPGNPNSPNAAQQNPYVIFKKNGVSYDVNGSPLKNASDPAAHIPLNKFNMSKMPKF